jgi:uncharacterized damage-inducible protein DinB
MLRHRLATLAVVLAVLSTPALAQTVSSVDSAANPLSATLKSLYEGVVRNIVESANKAPEDLYAFKPSPDVRSFGEMLGHVADGLTNYCSRAAETKSPVPDSVEKTKKTKAEIVKALEYAKGYCDGVYGSMTDADALKLVAAGENKVPKARFLVVNISHTNEHYGNLVTYLRIKGIVPPSTERAQQMRRP